MLKVPSNQEKRAVWESYRARRPVRVPLNWGVNSRIILLNPALNPEGWTYRDYFHEPRVTLAIQARFQEYLAGTLSRSCDLESTLPEYWNFCVESQNIYDAAYFGASVDFEPGQVPGTKPRFSFDDADEFLAMDYSRPLENPWIKERLCYREALVREAATFEYAGRRGKVAPFGVGFDGPLTAVASLFGADGIMLLGAEPEKARAVMWKITRDCLARNMALANLADGWKKGEYGGLADDSIQLISAEMYRELVMPMHAFWYEQTSATKPSDKKRGIHLCGDATRHFRTIRDELGVYSFDTGFPVDHGALRRELGPEVEISGGPHVSLFLNGAPGECAAEAVRILRSGVMHGGRFMLREGNNLPPGVPLENLQAVYEACIEHGRYGAQGGLEQQSR